MSWQEKMDDLLYKSGEYAGQRIAESKESAILEELKLAADMADSLGKPGDGNLYIRAIAHIRKLEQRERGYLSELRNYAEELTDLRRGDD